MKKNYPWRYAAFMITYYTVNAVYQGYISKYFQMRGATTAQLSVLLAAAPMISIVSQPFWGMRGDRAKSRNRVLRLMILLGVGLILMLPLSNAFGWMLLFNALFAAQYTSIQPMGDSIILESLLARGNQPFGPLRLCGSLSFAVVNLVFGLLVGERFEWVIYLTAALLVGVFLSTYLLPPTPGHQAETGRRMSLADLFRVPGMPPLLALFMMLQLCMGYFYSFFSIHFTSLPGGSMTLLGLAYFISATSELPFLLNADRLFDRLGAGRLMCLSALTMLTRWVLLAACPNVAVVLCSQVLHGGGFIVMSVSMAKHVNATVPAELKSSGQLLLAVVGFGLARVFGILGGGLLSSALGGTRHAFLIMAGVCALALILFAPRYFRRVKAD
ncbi:MAG: MFS transporter [Eubacteriales bacterium]|nr:MFS transporter [bacterium]MDY2793351.1 MFS transporter [Eubacteriales bacterium]